VGRSASFAVTTLSTDLRAGHGRVLARDKRSGGPPLTLSRELTRSVGGQLDHEVAEGFPRSETARLAEIGSRMLMGSCRHHHARPAAMDWMAWSARRLLAGWLGLLSPASSLISATSNIGSTGFFAFMLSMGIAMLSHRKSTP
jgi:hypothetical protein